MIKHFDIPELSDERLAELVERIRPVVYYQDVGMKSRFYIGDLYYIEPVDPRDASFLWDPVRTEPAGHLRNVGTIPTFHTYGHPVLFKPTIAEVLAMIPHTVIDRVVAFLTNGPKDAGDLNAQKSIVDAGYHMAQTHLYERYTSDM